jgi:AcrR family transcriptional regulator
MSSASEPSAKATAQSRKELVAERIVETATRLFADQGFASTSIQDIAEANGLTRSALYHYFPNKEAILSRLVSEATDAAAGELRSIREQAGRPVAERLRAMAASVALLQARHPARFQLLVRSEPDLPAELAVSYAQGRRRVLREFATVIDEGVGSGTFRPVDSRTAALGIIGLCNWVAWWHRPGGEEAAQQVADALADMAVASVAVPDRSDRSDVAGSGLARTVALLKKDVAELELLLERPAD